MTEQQPYQLVRRFAEFEVRRYPPHTVAEVTVEGPFERAGNAAFRYLFGYINGANTGHRTIEMTAPVVQQGAPGGGAAPEKIPMTAPVLQRVSDGAPAPDGRAPSTYDVAFVLPAGMTSASAPIPTDSTVRIRDVPGSKSAVLRFSRSWSGNAFATHRDELETALAAAGLIAVGPPRFARFDPPFMPRFLRHNEVVQDVEDG